MKKNLTELVFIIDRSGSMEGIESDTIGGFNAMLKEQQAVEGDAIVTTVLFDDQYELLHDRINIRAIAPLTYKDYTVRGTTALLDAVGRTIKKIRNAQNYTADAVGMFTAWTSMAGACIGVRTGNGLAGWCDSIKSGVSKSSGSTGST